MLEKKSGHFVVISSLVGKFGTPLRSGYAASKHALHGFFDSLRAEEAREGIDVTSPASVIATLKSCYDAGPATVTSIPSRASSARNESKKTMQRMFGSGVADRNGVPICLRGSKSLRSGRFFFSSMEGNTALVSATGAK